MQEDDGVLVLDRRQVHVGRARMGLGQLGQLEIVGREQGEAAAVVDQVARDRPGQRQAVEGRGAAPDFVHQHQRVLGGAVQDRRRFGHLDHEGRAAARQVVVGADAGEDAVDRADGGAGGRHIAADIGQQHDERGLAHEGRFTAHVRAGDEQQAALVRQLAVVRDEALDLLFDHRMAAFDDGEARRIDQLWCAPVVLQGVAGQGDEGVDLGDAGGDALQVADVRRQADQQLFVQLLFAHQGLVLGRQRLVLEGLQFRRDVALGVLERLAAAVVVGHLVGLAVGDLDIEAVHLVVLDAQVGDPGAGALARLQVDQELARVLRQGAQLVEFGVEAACEHAAVAHHGARLLGHRAREQVEAGHGCIDRVVQLAQQAGVARDEAARHLPAQCRQLLQAVAQAGQVARARRGQGDARGDAFDVGHLGQRAGQARCGLALGQRLDRLVARACHGLVALRVVQPVAQQARTHRRAAAVEQREQRRRFLAADGLGQLQVAAGGGIEADVFVLAFDRKAFHVLQAATLRGLRIAQQRPGRAEGGAQPVGAEAGQGGHGQLVEQGAVALDHVEMPAGHALGVGEGAVFEQGAAHVAVVGAQDFGRGDAFQFLRQARFACRRLAREFHQAQRAAGQRQPGQPGRDRLAIRERAHRQQRAFGLFRQQV